MVPALTVVTVVNAAVTRGRLTLWPMAWASTGTQARRPRRRWSASASRPPASWPPGVPSSASSQSDRGARQLDPDDLADRLVSLGFAVEDLVVREPEGMEKGPRGYLRARLLEVPRVGVEPTLCGV